MIFVGVTQRWLRKWIFSGSKFQNPGDLGFFLPKNPESKIPENPKCAGLGFFRAKFQKSPVFFTIINEVLIQITKIKKH